MRGQAVPAAARVVALTLLICGSSQAHAAEPPIQRWALDADTTILLVQDHKSPVVALSILLPISAWSPWARRYHGREAFTAQVHDTRGAIDREADQRSVAISAYAGRRASELKIQFLKEDRDSALTLLRRALHNRDYDHSALVRSKWARGPAWTAQQKEPEWLLQQAGARMLFALADPRRRLYEEPEPIATDVPALAQTRDAILRLPGRLIALVGDLSREEASQLCVGLLPPAVPLVTNPDPREALAPHYLPLSGRLHDTALTLDKLTQVYFSYSRPGLAMTDADFAKLLITDLVLGGSQPQGRLYAALRLQDGDTYGPSTDLAFATHPELYSLLAYTRTDNAAGAERKLRAVLQRLYQEGITEQEHTDAVNHLTQAYRRQNQQPSERLRLALWEWSHALPMGFYERLIEALKTPSRAEINAFIRRFYDPAQFALLKVGPPSR